MRLRNLFLLLIASWVLGAGISSPTSLTGKDEYFLGLRIPLEMMERDVWWVPFIDDQPRLKKPPLLYWAGRASYELQGPSLEAGRDVTLACALLLLGATVWLRRYFGMQGRSGLLAGVALIGMAGLATESRRLMLDVPVAAFSITAFCFYLDWMRRQRWTSVLGAGIFLCAALLTKGPIALVGCGGGILALWLTWPEMRRLPLRHPLAHGAMLAMALALPAYWLHYVSTHFGAQLAAATEAELEARQLSHVSADALVGILTLALPWTIIALRALWQRRDEKEVRFLGAWLAITLLPFCFINTFSRYLIASLVPLALLTALALEQGVPPRWTRLLGSVIPVALVLTLILLLWRWQLGGWGWLTLTLLYFVGSWWGRRATVRHLLISALLLWSVTWGSAFPQLGVNAVPQAVVDLARQHPVVLFAGPQPALLPALLHRPLRQTSQLSVALLPTATLVCTRLEDAAEAQRQAAALGKTLQLRLEYRALTSAGSGVKFARDGAGRDDWKQAWVQRTPRPLMSMVQIYEVMP